MRLKPFALGAIACACWGTGAVAQQAPPLGSERQYHASASLRGVYDSNFARSSKALADQRGIKQAEYTLTPRLDFSIVQPLGRQMLYASGGGGYQFHRENKNLDRVTADVLGGYIASLGFCQTSAMSSYRVAQSDLALLDTPGVKNTAQTTTISAGGQCGSAQGITGGLNVQRTEAKNSAASQKQADSDTEGLTAQVGYANPTFGRFALLYAYTNSEFPNRIIVGRPIGDGFFTQTIGLSGERQLGSRIKVAATAGRTTVKREFAPPGVDQKFTSNTYSGQLTYKLGSRLTLDLEGARAVQPTGRSGKLYDINTNGQISGAYKLGSRYLVTLGHQIQDIKSNVDTTLTPGQLVITNSRTNTTFASIRYTQSQRISVTLDARYDDRNANLSDFDYTSTRIGLSVDVGF